MPGITDNTNSSSPKGSEHQNQQSLHLSANNKGGSNGVQMHENYNDGKGEGGGRAKNGPSLVLYARAAAGIGVSLRQLVRGRRRSY